MGHTGADRHHSKSGSLLTDQAAGERHLCRCLLLTRCHPETSPPGDSDRPRRGLRGPSVSQDPPRCSVSRRGGTGCESGSRRAGPQGPASLPSARHARGTAPPQDPGSGSPTAAPPYTDAKAGRTWRPARVSRRPTWCSRSTHSRFSWIGHEGHPLHAGGPRVTGTLRLPLYVFWAS